jgi:hypothetical protein
VLQRLLFRHPQLAVRGGDCAAPQLAVSGIALAGFVLLGVALFLRGTHFAASDRPTASSAVIALSALIVPLAQIAIAFG